MKGALLVAALALGVVPPAWCQREGDGFLVGSIAMTPPLENIGRVALYLRPLGDPMHEFGMAVVNGGAGRDAADVQTDTERAWVFTRKLAPGRYEVVRMQSCLAISVAEMLLAPRSRRAYCSDLLGEQQVQLEVKAGAGVYVGRWTLALTPQQPPEPFLAWKESRIYLRDAYAEDVSLLAGKKSGNGALASVENPIAVRMGSSLKP